MKGKIITIEGLDGAGKSTQIKHLLEFLHQKNINHQFIHFPMLNQGQYGTVIAEYLRGEYGSIDQVHPKLVALLFAEDRNEHKAQLNQWLADGNWIIMDRYVKSNIAFQCAKTEDPIMKKELKDWILDFEFEHNQLPKPSLSMFLDVPFDQIKKSLSFQRTGEDRNYLQGQKDIHEDSISFQYHVLQEYYQLIEEMENFQAISCFDDQNNWLSPQEIHLKIRKLVNEKITQKQ